MSFLGEPSVEIMLLGTFHFANPGLDRYQPQETFDTFSVGRQRKIQEVIERLEAFRPTKIALEHHLTEQEVLTRAYDAYVGGRLELKSTELHQLGFRLAQRLKHEAVYAADVWDRLYEPYEVFEDYAKKHDQAHLLSKRSPWWLRFKTLYEHDDRLMQQQTLREYLLYLNSEKRITIGHGHYLVDLFKVGSASDYPGVDFVTAWYNRNLRIFANVQRMAAERDRLLVIIGAGHLPILRHAAVASPEFKLVEVTEYLG